MLFKIKNRITDFFYENASAICFWIVMFLLLPFILFFIKFDFIELKKVEDFGQFGAYLSGFSGYYVAIFSFVSAIILVATLLTTLDYNKKIIDNTMQDNNIKNIGFLCGAINNSLNNKNISSAYDFFSGRIASISDAQAYLDISERGKMNTEEDIYNYIEKQLNILETVLDIELNDELKLMEKILEIISNSPNEQKDIEKVIITGYLSKDVRFILYCYSRFKKLNLNFWDGFKSLPRKYEKMLISNKSR